METRSNYVMVGAVTLALLAGVLLFIVWLAGLSNKATKCYDIYFAQGVGGLNKGSNVSFSGVPVGQVQHVPAADVREPLAHRLRQRAAPARGGAADPLVRLLPGPEVRVRGFHHASSEKPP